MIFVTEHTVPKEFDSILYGTVGALIVAFLIKSLDRFFDRKKTELDAHVVLRKELREELDSVKQELSEFKHELDEWKRKYYDQVELNNSLKIDILSFKERLTVTVTHPEGHH